MSEEKKIKCVVLPGHEVNDGKTHQPGETIGLSESEADRLVELGIVELAKAKGEAQTPDPEVDAALKAVADGNVTRSGMPTAEAMAELLGKPVTAAERDVIWQRAGARG